MIWPLLLITLGILFLLNNIAPERFDIGRMWPVILIVIGLVKIFEYVGVSGGAGARRRGTEPPALTADPPNRPDLPAGRRKEDR